MNAIRLSTALVWLVLTSLVATTTGCTGDGCGGGGEPGAAGAPASAELSPPPPPPVLPVAPGAVAGELTVVVSRPQGDVAGEVRPTVTFSRPVMALGTIEQEQARTPVARIAPELAGEWRWLGSASVEFVPAAPVPYATEFTVTVPAGLRAIDGAELKAEHRFTFRTPRPRIQSAEPPEDTRWLQPEQAYRLVFDQPVAGLTETAFFEVGSERRRVAVRLLAEVDVEQELRDAQPERARAAAERGDLGWHNRQRRYELRPAERLPLETEVALVVPAGLRGTEGPLATESEWRLAGRTYGPMKILGVQACLFTYADDAHACPWGPLVLLTSNKAKPDSLRSRLGLEPAVEFRRDAIETFQPERWMQIQDPYAVIPGTFQPGQTLTVRLAAGVQDEFGQAAPAWEGTVRLSDLRPFFDLGSDEALLEAAGDGSLPVESANLRSLAVEAWPLTPAEMARLQAERHKAAELVQGAPQRHTLDLQGTHNHRRTSPLSLRELLPGGQRTGLLWLRATSPDLPAEQQRYPQQVFAQITDLAVHAKLGPQSGLVWVTSLSGGTSVPGAALELYDRRGAIRWRGQTGPDGTAEVPGLSGLLPEEKESNWSPPFAMVAANREGDTGVTLSSWSGGLDPWSFDLPADWEGRKPRPLGLVFAERGVYRPGDTVYLKGLLRARTLGKLTTPPPGTALELKVTSSRDETVHSQTLRLSRFGTFAAEFKLGADVPLGTYRVQASMRLAGRNLNTGGTFRVEEYRPPQFKVDVTPGAANLAAGDPLRAQVSARYLFGGAMTGAKVRWSVLRCTRNFTPPGNEGFAFGVHTWWWDDEEPDRGCDTFAGGEGLADAQGALALEPGKVETPGDKTYAYTVEAEVEDVNRQRLANRAEVVVHPAAVYAGVRLAGSGFAEAGKPCEVELVAADATGARQAGVTLELDLLRREWKSIRKQGVGNRWFTVSEPVEEKAGECRVESASTPARCSFTPEKPGLYILAATATDSAGRRQTTRSGFYSIGAGWVSWQRNDTDRIDLVADKTLYDVGETARVLVKSPYPAAEALLTVEREGVLWSQRLTLTGSAQAIEVPITERMIPNAFVGVVVARGRVEGTEAAAAGDDPGRPAVRVGYTQLKVERRSKRLAVRLTPDAAVKRPRDRVRLDLLVTDAAGAGVPAELTVWAVDEGVLRLTNYQLPDPVSAVHPERGLSVRIGEPLLHLVLRRVYGDKGRSSGGGGGEDGSGAGFRSRFKTTVVFVGDRVAGPDGRATVEFELPDNLTTYRLMALAVTEDDRFGAGQGELTVQKPLLALPALPRFARVGDAFEAGVVVHRKDLALPAVTVTAESRGGLALEGASRPAAGQPARVTREVPWVDDRAQEVRFRFRAEAPGEAVLRFSVEGGGERDGVEARLQVQLPVDIETVASYGDTTDQRVEGLVPPGGVRPGVGGLELTLASTALGGFDENLRQLVDYPYGCLEQLSSRLVPFVALLELQRIFGAGPGAPTADERERLEAREDFLRAWLGDEPLRLHDAGSMAEIARRTVRAIENLQRPDGGYGYWPDSRCSADWGSAYAVLALGRAQRAGLPVEPDGLARGERFLAETVAAGRCVACVWGCQAPSDPTRVFALYALARNGKPRASYYGELFARRDALPLFARAMLADALFTGGGERDQAGQLLTEIVNHARESAGEVHFEETDPQTYAALWSSDTRTTGIVLQTLADIDPAHPFVGKIARYLGAVRRADGRFRNTQEAAFALLALSELMRTKEREVPDFRAQVLLGEREIATAEFRGRSLDVRGVRLGLEALGDLSGRLPLTFRKSGPGVLVYGARLRYAPAELPLEALDRGLVVQRWFEPFGGGGQATAFAAGELIRVKLRVASHMERNYVAVEVPLPAGLEPVDTSLASTARQLDAPARSYEYESAEDQYGDTAGGRVGQGFEAFARSFWSPFNHTENRDDRVVLFADHLPPGVHAASFIARATTPGRFLNKPARAEEMYAPEVFGRSQGGWFEVRAAPEVAAK